MNKLFRGKVIFTALLMTGIGMPNLGFAASKVSPPTVTAQIFEKAKENNNWKLALLTGEHGQIVLMSISPKTNPKNEIGMETHPFDQIIFVAAGAGTADLNGKIANLKQGDMIFVPKGTAHNVINTNKSQPLKIVSVYTETDIPADSVIKTKADAPKD